MSEELWRYACGAWRLEAEDLLAEARVQFAEERRRHQESIDGWKHSWNCSREELAEARAIAVELARYILARGDFAGGDYCPCCVCVAYRAVRPGVRRWLEGK